MLDILKGESKFTRRRPVPAAAGFLLALPLLVALASGAFAATCTDCHGVSGPHPAQCGEISCGVSLSCHPHKLDTIFLGAPTSTDERLAQIAAVSSGFLYLISSTGVTGAKDSLPDDLPTLLRRARAATKLPLAVGFGISQPGHVSVLGGLVDAAVIGSALVAEIENATATDCSSAAIDRAATALAARIHSLKRAAQSGLSKREVAP